MSHRTEHHGIGLRVEGPGAVLGRIAAVAGNTLREAGRNRLFYGLVALAVLLLLFSIVLSDLALVDQRARLVQDFGLLMVPLVGVATAVLMGSLLLHKEIDRKTLYAILPKPVRRIEFVLGKLLGLCTLLLGQQVLLAAAWFAVLAMRGGEVTASLVTALGLGYLEIVLVTSVTLAFSALSRPVLSGLLTVGVFAIGRVSYVLVDLMQATKGVFAEVPAMRALGRVLVAVVPDLSTFNVSDAVLLGWSVPVEYVLAASAYGLSWTACFVAISLVVFERRDLI